MSLPVKITQAQRGVGIGLSLPLSVEDVAVRCPSCGLVGMVKRYTWPEYDSASWATECGLCGFRWREVSDGRRH